MLTVRNEFDILQKTSKRHTLHDGYENFGNSLEIDDKSKKKKLLIANLDIKLRQFIEGELDTILKRIKGRKSVGPKKILPKV